MNSPKLEIFLALVAPLGTKKELFVKMLRNVLHQNNIEIVHVPVDSILTINDGADFPKSFQTYLKMQICSDLREKYSNSILMRHALDLISKKRKMKELNGKIVIYLLDQLKNVQEAKILKHTYGLNFIQLSLFSSETKRALVLEKKFTKDDSLNKNNQSDYLRWIKSNIMVDSKQVEQTFEVEKLEEWIGYFNKYISAEATKKLIAKDFKETDKKLFENESGQQVSDLFHQSHYFINVDIHKHELEFEVNKFIDLFLGKFKEYPTQDEFGMSLAYQASVRSNFTNERQIGAAIIKDTGEVVSVASIRAPSKQANPTLADRTKVEAGYNKYRCKIIEWEQLLSGMIKSTDEDNEKDELEELKNFVRNSLDFHPCTHAEIAALLDAAKMGVSIKDSTLYTTTFPCHLCAKDIITAGINRVVYLEAYPKSKNRELYPNNITFDSDGVKEDNKVGFDFYCGIGPNRFYDAYSSSNKSKETILPWLEFEVPIYYKSREEDVVNLLNQLLREEKLDKNNPAYNLLVRKDKKRESN